MRQSLYVWETSTAPPACPGQRSLKEARNHVVSAVFVFGRGVRALCPGWAWSCWRGPCCCPSSLLSSRAAAPVEPVARLWWTMVRCSSHADVRTAAPLGCRNSVGVQRVSGCCGGDVSDRPGRLFLVERSCPGEPPSHLSALLSRRYQPTFPGF